MATMSAFPGGDLLVLVASQGRPRQHGQHDDRDDRARAERVDHVRRQQAEQVLNEADGPRARRGPLRRG